MLNIVCSIAMEGDWVNNLLIGTNFANVTSIITGNEDPHTYEAKPSDTTALINANWFIFFNNTELEPFWVPGEGVTQTPQTKQVVMTQNPNLREIALSNSSMILFDPLINDVNCHMYMDPNNVIQMVETIYSALMGYVTDSTIQATITQNYNNYLAKLTQLNSAIEAAKPILQGTKVVETHPFDMYLLLRLGMVREGVIELKEDVEPTQPYMQSLITNMTSSNTSLIVHEVGINPSSAVSIAQSVISNGVNCSISLGMEFTGRLGYDLKPVDNYYDFIMYNLNVLSHRETPDQVNQYWNAITNSNSVAGFDLGFLLIVSLLGISLLVLKVKTAKMCSK